ncbi:hypothetical protein D3C80_2173500 [compost metagenome]
MLEHRIVIPGGVAKGGLWQALARHGLRVIPARFEVNLGVTVELKLGVYPAQHRLSRGGLVFGQGAVVVQEA